MCNKHVHSTMTRSSDVHCLIGVINKPTKEHLLITRLKLCMTDPCTQFEVSSISRCGDFTWGIKTDDGRVVYITCIRTTCCGEIF